MLEAIQTLDIKQIQALTFSNPQGIAVLMPCTDQTTAHKTATILHSRSGIDCRIFIIYDSLLQGYIKTINQLADIFLGI